MTENVAENANEIPAEEGKKGSIFVRMITGLLTFILNIITWPFKVMFNNKVATGLAIFALVLLFVIFAPEPDVIFTSEAGVANVTLTNVEVTDGKRFWVAGDRILKLKTDGMVGTFNLANGKIYMKLVNSENGFKAKVWDVCPIGAVPESGDYKLEFMGNSMKGYFVVENGVVEKMRCQIAIQMKNDGYELSMMDQGWHEMGESFKNLFRDDVKTLPAPAEKSAEGSTAI